MKVGCPYDPLRLLTEMKGVIKMSLGEKAVLIADPDFVRSY